MNCKGVWPPRALHALELPSWQRFFLPACSTPHFFKKFWSSAYSQIPSATSQQTPILLLGIGRANPSANRKSLPLIANNFPLDLQLHWLECYCPLLHPAASSALPSWTTFLLPWWCQPLVSSIFVEKMFSCPYWHTVNCKKSLRWPVKWRREDSQT